MSRLALALALVVLATSSAHAEQRKRRDYAGTMVVTDLAILVSAIPVIARSDGYEEEVLTLYALAYFAAGPIIHGVNGNGNASGRSVAKRVLLPVGLGAVGFFGGISAGAGWGSFVLGAGGFALGTVIAVIWDWTTTHVDVGSTTITPTVSAGSDRVSLGLGGAF